MHAVITPQYSLGERDIVIWKMTEKIDNPGNEELDVGALKMEVLSGTAERTRMRMLDNMYRAIMTDGTELCTNCRKALTYSKKMM